MRAVLVCCLTVLSTAVFAAERPNVLVILTDDQGWGDLSLNGNTDLSTPNIDKLAADGAQFDRFYVCPVCSPTRAEFLTGRYHPRGGVYSTSAGGERLDLDEITIAQTFKAAGYSTAAFGKWHNGMQPPYHPNARGFDEYYGFCSGHWGDYFSPLLEHTGRLVKGNGFLVDDFTNHAMSFMEQSRKRKKPFFVYLPLNTPHSPMQVPDRWWDKFKDKDLKLHNRDPKRENIGHMRAALAMCENIDWNVGRLVKKLDDLQIADDTIVVYFCDNGPNGVRWNGGMKGRKGSTDEGGVRSPMIMRWPGRISEGKKVMSLGAAIDLLPTLADMAGVPIASKKPLDGISLKSRIIGSDTSHPERLVFSHWRGRVSARSQRFRIDHRGALFDMVNDPGQRRDLTGQHPEVASKMRAAVTKWKQELLPGLTDDKRDFPLGHPQYEYTQMPARDAKAHGTIKRSNRFPNCSYFTNWTNTDDKLTWDVDVLAAGQHSVQLYYTCRPEDVGTELELGCGDASIAFSVEEAHNPPEHGAENDRVKRSESFVKDWKVLNVGTIDLERGKQTLTLRATKIPGKQSIDFRLLLFERRK